MASREEDLLAALNELISSLKTTAKQDPQAFQIYLEAKWLRTCVENNNVHLPDWQLGIVGALKDGFIIRHPQSSEHLKRVAALVEKLE